MPRRKPVAGGGILCMVSWVYGDDGDGNVQFGDITRSYCSQAVLTPSEQKAIKAFLEPYYNEGAIMDVYVGPVANETNEFINEMASIGQCLPELGDD